MVDRRLLLSFVAVFAGAAAACQLIAGVEDKSLAPGAGGTDAGLDAPGADQAVPDVSEDSSVDVAADAQEEPETGGAYARRPPPRPAGDAGPSGQGKTLTLAARTFYLGAIDPETDVTTWEAWRTLGYDLDGKCTTPEESLNDLSGVCRKPPGANQYAHEDGEDCRDNIVGHELAGALKLLSIDYERKLQAQYRSGDLQTLVLRLEDLDDGADDPWVPGSLFVSAPFPSAPLWDGSDRPLIDSASVLDGGLAEPKYTMNGYLKDHIWVSGDFPGPGTAMPFMAFDRITEVPTKSTTLTVQLDPGHTRALRSTVAAAMGGPEMLPVVMPGLLEVVSCDVFAAQVLFDQYFAVNRDLASTGTGFVDPAAECDSASIGIGVEWRTVKAPDMVVLVPPKPYPCDAGLD